jgi:hypothetical protein
MLISSPLKKWQKVISEKVMGELKERKKEYFFIFYAQTASLKCHI